MENDYIIGACKECLHWSPAGETEEIGVCLNEESKKFAELCRPYERCKRWKARYKETELKIIRERQRIWQLIEELERRLKEIREDSHG